MTSIFEFFVLYSLSQHIAIQCGGYRNNRFSAEENRICKKFKGEINPPPIIKFRVSRGQSMEQCYVIYVYE